MKRTVAIMIMLVCARCTAAQDFRITGISKDGDTLHLDWQGTWDRYVVQQCSSLTTGAFAFLGSVLPTNHADVVQSSSEGFFRIREVNVVHFPDAVFEQYVRGAIPTKYDPPNSMYDIDLLGITNLDAGDSAVSNLTGIGWLPDLTTLRIDDTFVSDETPIRDLSRLEVLFAPDADFTTINLIGMTRLTTVRLDSNYLTDASGVSSLLSLTYLNLNDNHLTDVTPLADLTNLTWLGLQENTISNAAPLANLTTLQELYIGWNTLSEVTALASLTNLTYLSIAGNQITDITPLLANAQAGGLGVGDTVQLNGNPISDTNQISTLEQTFGVTVIWY